jgi:hypothetical protein
MREQTSSGGGHYAGAIVHEFVHDEPDGLRFAVVYADATDGYPTTTSPADSLAAIEGANVRSTGGRQVLDRDLSISGYPGREEFIDGPSASYVFRMVYVGTRAYVFSVKGSKSEVHEAMVIVFLDSFRVSG